MARHSSRLSGRRSTCAAPICAARDLRRLVQFILRQHRQRIKIDAKPDAHADTGRGKTVVPADFLAERAADQRRQERAEIDADIEDRIGAVAAMIAGRVKAADLRGNIRLETAIAEDQRQQREDKELLESHHEMADGHQHRADDDGVAPTKHTVGEQSAENRREINEPRIKAPDLRRQRLHVERTEHGFKRMLDGQKPGDIAGVVRQQQIFRHVKDEQRAHPVIGEALPHLGREQESEPARMAEQIGTVTASQVRRAFAGNGFSHDCSAPALPLALASRCR